MSASPLKTLGLAGDGDEIELIELFQEAFGVEFPVEALADCRTVGDLHALLTTLHPPALEQGRCASAMAFYRLRRALIAEGCTVKLRPSTRLDELTGFSPWGLWRRVAARLDLTPPTPRPDWAGRIGRSLIGLSLVFSLVGLFLGVPPVLLLFLIPGILLVLANRGDFGDTTLGDWAEETANRNRIALMREGADRREASVWIAAVHFICFVTGASTDRVRRETRLIA
jgi:hypothetical protein